jgi:hypothetical protein
MNYLVEWAIDIEADSPQEAAQLALETQRDETSTATVFTVSGDGNVVDIDLSEGRV